PRGAYRDATIKVKNSTGLDPSTVLCEYSTDRGLTWQEHTAECTGTSGTRDVETVTVQDIPFVSAQAGNNLVRFSIKNTSGKVINSAEYPVMGGHKPKIEGLKITRSGDNVDMQLTLRDEDGLRIGSAAAAADLTSISLYAMDGNGADAEGRNNAARFVNGGAIKEVDTWKSLGGKEQATCFDGSNDYAQMGDFTLGRTQALTISGWVYAENNHAFIAAGNPAERGNLMIKVAANGVLSLAHNDVTNRGGFGLATPAGSMKLNAWQHFAFTYDGDEGHLYVNGQKLASGKPNPGAWSFFRLYGFRPLRLAVPSYDATFFKGCVDDLHILSRALSEEEIASTYYSGMYRVSTDGGLNWTAWEKLELSAADGTKEPVEVSVSGVPLPPAADSMNRIEFTARDIYGNTSVQQYILLADGTVSVAKDVVSFGKLSFSSNPFYDKTAMSFTLGESQFVEVKILEINGKMVKSLFTGILSAGKQLLYWDGTDNFGSQLSGGQYFVRMKIGNRVEVKKILKLR
ncbi:MAG: hypothetical protein HQK83_11000, partial [Fibrobacteria bacterium]|nr:hypothetical protein [Fibrobacteria bacterium]